MSKLSAADVKKAALDFGADLVGIGSIDRWKDVPKDQNPRTIMPRAKSVICIGFCTHRGIFRGVEEGTYFSAYTLAGVNDVNRVLAPMVLHRLAGFIERRGFETCPIMLSSGILGNAVGRAALAADGTEKPKPDVFVNFRVAAVLCGVGEIGYNRLVLTPEFGPAQRLFFLVTEAELEPDPIISGLCDHCGACMRNCPARALTNEPEDNIDIPGVYTIRRCSIDPVKCMLASSHGAFSPFAPQEVTEYARNIVDGDWERTADGHPRPTAEEIKANVTDKVSYVVNSKANFNCSGSLCAECMRTCLAHLDKVGKLSRKYQHLFRE